MIDPQAASTGPERNPALPLGPTLGRISTPDQAEHRLSRDSVPNHFEPYGKPVFGPATRALPQLHIDVNDEGCFYVKCDFIEPVGPAFWESRLGRVAVRRGHRRHMFRTFFTGAFRKPRETNWTIGVTIAILAGLEGLTGYSDRSAVAAADRVLRHLPGLSWSAARRPGDP